MLKPDTPLEFVGSSRDDLSAFPLEVKQRIGFALRAAQKGGNIPTPSHLKDPKARVSWRSSQISTATPSGRLHSEAEGRHLRASRVSEEVQEGHRNAEI